VYGAAPRKTGGEARLTGFRRKKVLRGKAEKKKGQRRINLKDTIRRLPEAGEKRRGSFHEVNWPAIVEVTDNPTGAGNKVDKPGGSAIN